MPESPRPVAPPPPVHRPSGSPRVGTLIVAFLVVLLLIFHQDNWFWTDDRLFLGFMPIGLAWHAGISIGASLTWFLATKIAWPIDPEVEVQIIESSVDTDQQEAVR